MQAFIRWLGNVLGVRQESEAAVVPANESASHTKVFPKGLVAFLCLAYICVVGFADGISTKGLDLDIFYLAGCAFAGWAAGLIPALLAAFLSGAFLWLDKFSMNGAALSGWIAYANFGFRLLGFTVAGWLAFELGKRSRALQQAVREQTGRLYQAVEKHKGTAQFLREALRFLKQFTQNFADVFWVTNPTKTEVEYVSPEFEKVWGESCATLYESPGIWLARVHQEDRERIARAMRQKQVTGEYDEEYRVVRSDGVVRWVRDRAFPVKDEHGAVYQLVGIAEDITARKHAQQMLEAQRDAGVAFGAAPDLNAALQRLVEITVQLESFDCGAVYLLDPKSGELELKAHRGLPDSILKRSSRYLAGAPETRIARTGKLTYMRDEQIPRTGELLWGGEGLRALVLVPLRCEGTALGVLHLASYRQSEISPETRVGLENIASQVAGALARLAAEESLRRSEAHLRSIVNSAPIALVAADARGVITLEDGQALDAMGFRTAEHVGQPAAVAFKDNPLMLDDLDRALAGEEFGSVVEFGSTILENRYTPGPGGGFIAVAMDVTERVRLQRLVLEISDREQARIGQDVHDGLCQQLIGMALKANAVEKSLAAQALPEAAAARKICSLLDEAITESRRVCRGLYPVRLKTEGLVPALEELALSTAERYQVECRLTTSERYLQCDEATATHLYRIAQEAITNAVKHSGCHVITLLLSCASGQIELSVQDDGKGLKPGARDRAGTGMGLHIMEYRARTMGGRLRVSSDPGGTLVKCQVPQPVVAGRPNSAAITDRGKSRISL